MRGREEGREIPMVLRRTVIVPYTYNYVKMKNKKVDTVY